MQSEVEGCGHPTSIDKHSLEQEEVDHYGGEELEVAQDTSGEYNPLVLDG